MSDAKMTVMEFCGQCKTEKFDSSNGGCKSYPTAGQERWMRLGGCPLGNVDLNASKEIKKHNVNPLKASKRGGK